MAREKVADIRIRAKDESGPALQRAKAALDSFNQAAQRASQRRQTIGIQKAEIDGIRDSYTRLTGDMARLQAAQDRMRASGTATQSMLRESSEAISLVRNRARESVAALAAKRAELQRLGAASRNSFAAFSRGADAMREQAAAARSGSSANQAQSATAKQNADELGRLARRSAEVARAQTQMRGETTKATTAMAAQSSAMRGQAAQQNWGSPVQGNAQDIMAFGLRPYQLTNLSYQVNDVVSGIAMGQPVMQVFTQQIGQILQIFPAFARGMMGIFTILERFKLLAGVAGLALGGFVTAIVRVNREARESETALNSAANNLRFLADSADYSVEGMGNAALAIKAYTGDLEKAIQVTRQFAAVGIRESRFDDLARQASQFSTAVGIEMPEAASRLADAFTGGFEGIRELDEEFNFLSRSALATARSLFESGRVAEAQEFVFGQLGDTLGSMTTQAAGPWSQAFTSLGRAWRGFTDWLSDTIAIRAAISILNSLGETVNFVAGGLEDIFTAENLNANVEEFLALSSVEELEAALETQQQLIDETRSNIEGLAGTGTFVLAAQNAQLQELLEERELLLQAISDAQSGVDRTAGLPAEAAETPGLTQDQLEEIGKRYDDFRAEIAATNAVRAEEVALIGLSTRERAREIALREFEASVLGIGAAALEDYEETRAQAIQQINDSIDAQYDAIEAQERLTAAEQAAEAMIQRTRTEREQSIQVIRDTEAALEILRAEYERTGDPAIAAQIAAASAALIRFQASANNAASGARDLRNAALDLRDALATIGSFNADLESRLNSARTEIFNINQGMNEIQLSARRLAQSRSEEIDSLIASGYSIEQAAAEYDRLVANAEATLAVERERDELWRATFNPSRQGGGGGGGGGDPVQEERNRLEQELNSILEYRTALLAEIQFQESQGNASEVSRLSMELTEVNVSAEQAIENMIAFLSTLTGPGIEAAILNLQNIRRELGNVGQQAILTGEQANNMIADGVSNAFDKFAQDVANGENAIKSLRDAFLQFASDFIREIAQMIIRQAVLNALQGGGGAGGGVGGFLSNAVNALFRHSGGMANSGGGRRMVNPAVFAGAARFHGGGIAGLGPREVPAILLEDEEVLTADDPRHARNGGASGSPVNIKNVNVFDAADMLEKALSTAAGERVLINYISRNSRQVKGAIG